MPESDYASNVFLNFPFDPEYTPLRNAILFAVHDCGFVPRCALEVDDSGDVRFEKILRLIDESKYGIHDICRTELDPSNGLPRFNMPLELGVFLGARRFGTDVQKTKSCLIVDCEAHRYQKFISDISGHDIRAHNDCPDTVIKIVRDWLNSKSRRKTLPGGSVIVRRFKRFMTDLPDLCIDAQIDLDELTYYDYVTFIPAWLIENAE
jgi:hypothetical protein